MEGQETINIFYFRKAEGAEDDVLTHLVLIFLQCFVTSLLPGLDISWTLERVTFKKVSPALGNEGETTEGLPAPGQSGNQPAPSFVSALISIRTVFLGRSGRGRLYIPGVSFGDTEGSALTAQGNLRSALLAFVACLVAHFIQDPNDVDIKPWNWVQYSRKIGGAGLPYGANGFHLIESASVVSQLATTRSRKVGRGS
jgi:hypothetical protein